MGRLTSDPDRTEGWVSPHRPVIEESLSRRPLVGPLTPQAYLLEVPTGEEPERAAFAFFAWRFSFSDLLAVVFELFEPPLSLLAMVAPSRWRDPVLNLPLGNPTER